MINVYFVNRIYFLKYIFVICYSYCFQIHINEDEKYNKRHRTTIKPIFFFLIVYLVLIKYEFYVTPKPLMYLVWLQLYINNQYQQY
jgi:hypothetical protein